jgi:diaminopimelate decarboxylase
MVLYGPLCMNIDMIRESVNMPVLEKGDQVVIHMAGAYNMTQWMQFITYRPNVVLIDSDGNPHIIRNAEKLADLTDMEQLPEHLENTRLK